MLPTGDSTLNARTASLRAVLEQLDGVVAVTGAVPGARNEWNQWLMTLLVTTDAAGWRAVTAIGAAIYKLQEATQMGGLRSTSISVLPSASLIDRDDHQQVPFMIASDHEPDELARAIAGDAGIDIPGFTESAPDGVSG